MSSVSTCLMFTVLLSTPPPNVTGDAAPQGDESALPKYDEAPAPVAEPAPGTRPPLTPEQVRSSRRVGKGLSIAGGLFLAAGVAGLIVGLSGLGNSPHLGSDYFERKRRQQIGLGIGASCSAIGVTFSIVGAALQAQARSAPKLQVSLSPTWLYDGGGITVGGRF
jgi:hypothetical protein